MYHDYYILIVHTVSLASLMEAMMMNHTKDIRIVEEKHPVIQCHWPIHEPATPRFLNHARITWVKLPFINITVLLLL